MSEVPLAPLRRGNVAASAVFVFVHSHLVRHLNVAVVERGVFGKEVVGGELVPIYFEGPVADRDVVGSPLLSILDPVSVMGQRE